MQVPLQQSAPDEHDRPFTRQQREERHTNPPQQDELDVHAMPAVWQQ